MAGHAGDARVAVDHLDDPASAVRGAALGALARAGELTDEQLQSALADEDPDVRRRAAELAARHGAVGLLDALHDADPTVVEMAAWACGERERVDEPTMSRLIELTTEADDPLVREASAAALGAIGDPLGLPAVLRACDDKPAIRRRAVLALAPFDGEAVDAALRRALDDRDWQVRQAAEDVALAAGLDLDGRDHDIGIDAAADAVPDPHGEPADPPPG